MPETPVVGVIMGSDSDLPVMQAAADVLVEFGVAHEVRIISAHRTPEEMIAYGKSAAGRGLKAIIAGAGGGAHLPGMVASVTPLPVIGVPGGITKLQGLDALLPIVPMPTNPIRLAMNVSGHSRGDRRGGQRAQCRAPGGAYPGRERSRTVAEDGVVPEPATRAGSGEGSTGSFGGLKSRVQGQVSRVCIVHLTLDAGHLTDPKRPIRPR